MVTIRSFLELFKSKNLFVFQRLLSDSSLIQHSQNIPESRLEKNVLQKSNDDLSPVAPYLPNTFNLAAYINYSETLQNLVHLNVNLSKIEKKKPFIVEKIVKLNFNNIKDHILFIKDNVGIDNIGSFITANPMILYENLEDLKVRINYLKSKCFSDDEIKRIITKNPFWLMFSAIRIDRRLGHFQDKFKLSGNELRILATKQPKLITYNLHHIKTNSFVIKEEMGFEENEIKDLLLTKPRLWMIGMLHNLILLTFLPSWLFLTDFYYQMSLLHRFNYVHNTMEVPHATILKSPGILLSRNFRVKQRHLFLEKLGRAQYNPKKENYVPIIGLVEDTDIDFCKNYAKCNVSDFNTFLKTL